MSESFAEDVEREYREFYAKEAATRPGSPQHAPRIGSLCTGYGGLDLGVQAAVGGHTVWVSDIDKGSCKLLAHRYPDLPNLGDFTKTNWLRVPRVDVLTAGFPCQPVSHAGKRLGDEDERWLWDDVARAVRELRPGLVVLENVRGLLTAGSGRLFGRVLGTLADLGYDAQWHGLRAADVGAPHGRWRVFILATDTRRLRGGKGWTAEPGQAQGGRSLSDVAGRGLLPTPTTRDHKDHMIRREPHRPDATDTLSRALTLLPTPAVNDMGEGKTVEAWDDWTAKMKAAHGNGNGHGASLAIEAQRLLPTPRASDGPDPSSHGRTWSTTDNNLHTVARNQQWGDYAPAIARWEATLGRTAPPPTMTSAKGNPQLSPAFVEFLMGLPAGWVTDVPGVTRNEALKLCGNGVVPQQAEAALRVLLDRMAVAA